MDGSTGSACQASRHHQPTLVHQRARDGLCYPNGYLPPQDQAARQYQHQRYYRSGRYPVPCGHGTDIDIRDGLCYPNGTVPPQFQQGRQRYYGDDGYYERRPQRRYYYPD
jgi:hypothetical protein